MDTELLWAARLRKVDDVKLQFDIAVDAGLDKVWSAFDNPDNRKLTESDMQRFKLMMESDEAGTSV